MATDKELKLVDSTAFAIEFVATDDLTDEGKLRAKSAARTASRRALYEAGLVRAAEIAREHAAAAVGTPAWHPLLDVAAAIEAERQETER